MRKIIIILLFIVLYGCTKELSIADFSDDFNSYKSELRIEAILNSTDFMSTVVRIDKTFLVTDTSLFNGIDDNGDWVAYTDENENGKWDKGEPLNDDIGGYDGGEGNGIPDAGEPHVDDYIEILPLVHDSTMISIELAEKSTGNIIAEFEWNNNAGTIEYLKYGKNDGEESVEFYNYGGYIPLNQYSNVQIDFNKEYEFQIITPENDFITGSTSPFNPAELIMDGTDWNADTLLLNTDDDLVQFLTDENVSLSNFTFREIFNADSIVYSYSTYFPPGESNIPGKSLYQLSKGFFPIGLSELTVSVLSKDYSQYFISSLPLRDEALSNLHNQNGNVILGIAGSATVTTLYVKNLL
ncbi:hypothetical protein ACFL5D_02280 [Candidatus Neomarinimicrobiota bacterium]